MNSMERTIAAVTFGKPDRVPVMPQVFGHSAVLSGATLEDYIRNGEILAECQLKALKHYNTDAVFAVMDVNVETEALGSVLNFNKNNYATIETFALSNSDDFSSLKLPDPKKDGRMPQMLKALRLMKLELGDTVPIIGCVLGPLTLVIQLLGAEQALFLSIDEPDKFMHLLDFAADVAICFGIAQLEAGAHLPVIFDPSASPAMVPHQFFREFEMPRLTRLFSELKKAGSALNWLHIAGPTESIMPYYKAIGVNIANIDYYVSAQTAIELLPDTCVNGNIASLDFVEAEPGKIDTSSRILLSQFKGHGGFILSSGCEIPPEAKSENIAALVQAVQQ